MTLSRRIALLVALAATVSAFVAAAVSVLVVRISLHSAVDEVLLARVETLTRGQVFLGLTRGEPAESFVGADGPVVLVDVVRDDVVIPAAGITATVPVTPAQQDLDIGDPALLETLAAADGTPVRVATDRVTDRLLVRAMRTDTDVTRVVRRTALSVLAVGLLVAAGVATAGAVTARRMMAPVRDLAATATRAAYTRNPASAAAEIPHGGSRSDEVAELAAAMREMLTSLAASRAEQQRLVDDAAHELRTPLTSLRTNVELLLRASRGDRPLPPADIEEALAGIGEEAEDLSALVQELVALASGSSAAEEPHSAFRLDEVVAGLVARSRRRSGRDIEVRSRPLVVEGPRGLIERSVANILSNALKYTEPDAPVIVTVSPEGVVVEDGGPGMPADQRLRATERFWRAPESRATPGSGLGLSLVAEAMTRIGGSVTLTDSSLGGLRVECRIPGIVTASP